MGILMYFKELSDEQWKFIKTFLPHNR